MYTNLVTWLLLLGLKVVAYMGIDLGLSVNISTNNYFKGFVLNFYLLLLYLYNDWRATKNQQLTWIDKLRVFFIVGLVTSLLSLIVQWLLVSLEDPSLTSVQMQWIDVLYHLNIAILLFFLTHGFFLWKQMILHPKTKILDKWWNIFEYILLISLMFNFFNFSPEDAPFFLFLLPLLGIALRLCFSLQWVVFLNSKEKWQAIFFLTFIIIFSYHFFYLVLHHTFSAYYTNTELMHSVYVLMVFIFVIFYGLFSLLVLLFNLPTSGMLKQKIEEVLSFQRLVQALQDGGKEQQIYDALLDSTMQAVEADAAWVEIVSLEGRAHVRLARNIEPKDISKVKRALQRNRIKAVLGTSKSPTLQKQDLHEETLDFNVVFTAPLTYNEKFLGALTLLREQNKSFEDEQEKLIQTFAKQASISVENFRLFNETMESERLKEEMKIAQHILWLFLKFWY